MPCPGLPGGIGNILDWAVQQASADTVAKLLKFADGYGLGRWLAQSTSSAVYNSARRGESQVLKELLAHGAPVDQHGPLTEAVGMRRSALFAAVLQGHPSAAATLISAGAWRKEDNRDQVLHHARQGGFGGIFGTELAREIRLAAPNPEVLREELQEAILAADLRAVEDAVRRGAPLQKHYYSEKASTRAGVDSKLLVNPVDWAALEGCPNVARHLLELESKMHFAEADKQGPNTWRALHIAARRGGAPRWLSLARMLLEHGAPVEHLDPWGRSPLHTAVMHGNADCAKLLVDRGAWLHEEKREEVLQLAVSQRVDCVVEAAGASPSKAVVANTSQSASENEAPKKCKTALVDIQTQQELVEVQNRLKRDIAKGVKSADMHAIHACLERGADLEVEVDLGYGICGNLIDLALFHEHGRTALALLELGGTRGIAKNLAFHARHAMFWAIQQDCISLLEELLKLGASPAQVDEICGSALRCAAEQSRLHAVVLLLAAGAWKEEAEKELVRHLLKDRRLLETLDLSSGRGLGIADDTARERLITVVHDVLEEV
jgi:ankyrin repeat protein